MNITGEDPTAVDEARQQHRGADDGFLDVGVAAVLARRDGPHAFIFRGAIDAAEIRRQCLDRLGRQHRAARIIQRLLALQPLVELWLVREHTNGAHERIHRYRDSRHVLRARFDAIQLPVDDVGIGKHISQESESRHDRGGAEFIGRDVHHGYRDGVAALCPFNVDGSCQRMAAVQIDGRHILGRRIEVEVGIESIARLENEMLPRLYMGDWFDRVVNPVEAVWIIFAVLA